MINERVQNLTPQADEWEFHGDFIVAPIGKRWRIYESAGNYSQVSGQTIRKGLQVRRWDPEAGNDEGKAATFRTLAEAVDYIDRWLS